MTITWSTTSRLRKLVFHSFVFVYLMLTDQYLILHTHKMK